MTVISNSFAGTSYFCVCKDEIETFCNNLEKMYSLFSGSSKLNDNDCDGDVEFIIYVNGQLKVCGQGGSSKEDHFVIFEFMSDQTCIPQFVIDFKKLLKL